MKKAQSDYFVGVWSSGNSTDFDSVALGSIPSTLASYVINKIISL